MAYPELKPENWQEQPPPDGFKSDAEEMEYWEKIAGEKLVVDMDDDDLDAAWRRIRRQFGDFIDGSQEDQEISQVASAIRAASGDAEWQSIDEAAFEKELREIKRLAGIVGDD